MIKECEMLFQYDVFTSVDGNQLLIYTWVRMLPVCLSWLQMAYENKHPLQARGYLPACTRVACIRPNGFLVHKTRSGR